MRDDRVRWHRAVAAAPPSRVATPTYDPATVRPGLAHIGVGNFHRAHQAVYVDDLLRMRADQSAWGFLGVELLDNEVTRRRAAAMERQRNAYTHTEFDPHGGHRSRVVGSIVEHLHSPRDPDAVVRRLCDPALRVVTMTITEGGYAVEDSRQPVMEHGTSERRHRPLDRSPTAFDVLVGALEGRRAAGAEPFAVLSCDNLPRNGEAARRATVRAAEAKDPRLAEWIAGNVAFPSSMVDRITPAVDPAMGQRLNALTGLPDHVPVFSEDHRQWVVEDLFPAARPAWEDVGVELRGDVASFVAMKGRILNAAHSLLAYTGLPAGHTYVHEASRDPRLAGLVEAFVNVDVVPLIKAPPGFSVTQYAQEVLSRFANREVPDTVLRVAQDGGAKLPAFVSATARELLSTGDLRRLALLVASFRAYVQDIERHGEAAMLEPHLRPGDWRSLRSTDALVALTASPFDGWGLDLSDAFRRTYLAAVETLQADGIAAAAEAALGASPA